MELDSKAPLIATTESTGEKGDAANLNGFSVFAKPEPAQNDVVVKLPTQKLHINGTNTVATNQRVTLSGTPTFGKSVKR